MHPARQMTFQELSEGLADAVAGGLVNEHRSNGLALYCYTRSCVYDRLWTPFSLIARGLIVNHERQEVAATPFPKFFNVGEGEQTIPALPFETYEKVDGSLIIAYWHDEWMTATKGSLSSDQAKWARSYLHERDISCLSPGTTYLFEAVYPENRIVVHYDDPALIVLGGYREDGSELSYDECRDVAERLGTRAAARHSYTSIADLLSRAKTLPANEEGFVVRFSSGLRLKVKGDEYKRIHSLISNCTPLAMWAAMQAGDDLSEVRRDLPEEFWGDFDAITASLSGNIHNLCVAVAEHAAPCANLSDKEVGLRLATFPAHVRPFIFPYRKSGGDLLSGRTRQALFRAVRPTANRLDGYTPSYAMHRVTEESL